MLTRQLEKDLEAWRVQEGRKPLLVRGARQVGKSSLIESFGAKKFKNTVTINFELAPAFKTCFQSLNPRDICNALSLLAGQAIVAGETLLFLDEIQDCPAAIQSLRYFKENMPELHVIGAESLLELALNQAEYRMPVGRVAFLYLYPLSFKEFLRAYNPDALPYLESASVEAPFPSAIHEHLLKQLKLYLWLGGMPEVLQDYKIRQDFQGVQAIQSSILETYEKDFGHYHAIARPTDLQHCFRQAPLLIGQQIKYNKIDREARSRELKQALRALEAAAVLQRIQASSAQGLPLDATLNEKKFKLNFIDVGLVKRMNQLDASLLLSEDIMLLNQGALAEQFVGQELLAYAPAYEKAKLYFWARDGQGVAEVDYLFVQGAEIYPIEVKSAKSGKLKSLQQYQREHRCPFGIRVSPLPLSFSDGLLSLPLYLLSELPRLVRSICD
jgi:predicted AAA+ superfamily ATPase